jgi:hypothetical protein
MTMRARIPGAIAFAVYGALTARLSPAQTPGAYRPGFHVRNYDIAIDVPDSGAKIHACATHSCSTCSISRSRASR